VRRVAWLWIGGAEGPLDNFRKSLADAGYAEGRNLALEVVVVEQQDDKVRSAVDAVLARGVELIVAQGPVVPVVHRAVAARVPVVIAFSGDPVEAGLVDSLRRPGRRTTGVSFLTLEMVGKRLELLKEMAPRTRRVGVLLNSRHYGYQAELAETQRSAAALGMETETFAVRTIEDFPATFAAMARHRLSGIVIFPDALMTRMGPEIARFALGANLPLVSGWAQFPRDGALASYGPDLTEAYRRVGGHYAARILQGQDPSTMPVEQASRLYMVINLATATALGLTLPPSILARADEVIR
jgi:putative ABC transport system substrate-binding protein